MPSQSFNLKARKSGVDASVISLDSPPDFGQPFDPNRLNCSIDQVTWNEDAQAWHELQRASQPKRPADPVHGGAAESGELLKGQGAVLVLIGLVETLANLINGLAQEGLLRGAHCGRLHDGAARPHLCDT